jgi:hypothetical protein
MVVALLMCLWGGVITGCGKPAMVGLYPITPPVARKGFSLLAEFVEVDTLTPTFRWRPLTLRAGHPTEIEAAKIENTTYEIRIWRVVRNDTGKLVDLGEKLTTTEYRPEKPLDPGTRYYWTVRAHFMIDGQNRTTEWALAGYLLRNEAVPNDSCLRFKTPEMPDTTSKVSQK